MKQRLAALFIIVALVGAACSSDDSESAATPPPPTTGAVEAPATTSSTAAPVNETVAPEAGTEEVPLSPLAGLVDPVGSALYNPEDHVDNAPAPTSISISRLDVDGAPVVDVGVEENGDMELPGAEAVGWYRFNAKPGQEGSSVLAAHINYNGTNGVFRYLSKVEIGDRVVVGFEDGSSSEFEIVEVARYDKQELPIDRIFAKTGGPILTLITCGGSFNRSLRSYEDNFVAYAIPVEA
jgi:LPXTG-site transpeptidase (sortase) family protein